MDEKQLLAKLPISLRTLSNWNAKGILPYIKSADVACMPEQKCARRYVAPTEGRGVNSEGRLCAEVPKIAHLLGQWSLVARLISRRRGETNLKVVFKSHHASASIRFRAFSREIFVPAPSLPVPYHLSTASLGIIQHGTFGNSSISVRMYPLSCFSLRRKPGSSNERPEPTI